jgi:3-oxoacyl-[acyl-carrier protein] reductase
MALAEEGCDLLLASRDAARLGQAKDRILTRSPHIKTHTFACDFSHKDGSHQLIDYCRKHQLTPDIIVCNSGGPKPSSAMATNNDAWALGFQNLFLSFTHLIQNMIEPMKAKKFGRIISISSTSVLEPIDNLAVSSSMRAAFVAFCKTIATEVAADGITVNVVMPGVIHTQRIEDLRRHRAESQKTTLEIEMQKTSDSIPSKRMGRPEEFAAVVAFLASSKASYVTGTHLTVDGGLSKGW